MQLRDYQIRISNEALKILSLNRIVYLSMQTRTGKTITAFNIAEKYGSVHVLFVTKKKAIGSIESDAKFFPGLNVTVTNFESVHKISGKYDIAIIDECHSLSQYPRPAKRYIDLKKLVYGLPCILLSATPSPESFSQLYHQFTINGSHPWCAYKNFYLWARDYVDKKVKYVYNREIADYSNARAGMVDKATKKYMLSFTQTEAGIVNQITEEILYCFMKPRTQEIISEINKNRVIILKNGSEILGDTPVKLMQKVLQLSSGTIIDEDGNGFVIDYSKALFIRKYFENEKISIFYKFKQEFELLKKVFPKYTTSPEEFQTSEDLTFMAQFQSGREGIRIDTADAIVFYNIDFSALSYLQAKNRIVSKERVKEAKLYFVFNIHGIEPKIYDVVMNKKSYTSHHYMRDYVGKRYSA